MKRIIRLTPTADRQLKDLETDKALAKRLKAVRKALGLMEVNLKHPGLQTYEYHSLKGENGEKVFEAHAEQKTAAAYRIFWHCGPERDELTIIAITRHP